MKFIILNTFIMLITSIRTDLSTTKKICKDCKYFIDNTNKCKKYGEIDLVTGKVTNDLASNVRINKNYCGEDGIYFEKNNFKFITIPYYFLLEYWGYSPAILLISLYLYTSIYNID